LRNGTKRRYSMELHELVMEMKVLERRLTLYEEKLIPSDFVVGGKPM
jgi:hypothetical protein